MDVRPTIVSANLGGFEKPGEYTFTDENYPPRLKAMTPRTQARIVKMFMWQFVAGYTHYIWLDGSLLPQEGTKGWFMDKLGNADIAVLKHPHRSTVQEEANYLRTRLSSGDPYLTSRYENEDINGQLSEVDPEAELYASTAFIYRDSPEVRLAMKEWWYHTSRYHIIDQLSLPWAIRNLKVNVMPQSYLKIPYIEHRRTG